MSITVEATYENGMLRPSHPLPLKENEKVCVTIQQAVNGDGDYRDDPETTVRRSSGMIGWTGDAETLRRLALSAEFDSPEAP